MIFTKRKKENIKEFLKADIILETRDRVAAENLRMLYMVNAAFTFFSLGLLIYVFFTTQKPFLEHTYSIFFCVSLIMFLFQRFVVEKHRNLIIWMIVIDYILINFYLLRIGIFYHHDTVATSFYIFMGLAFCFLVRPYQLIIFQTATACIFSVYSLIYKEPVNAEADVINAMMMMIMSIVLGCTILKFRMNSLQKLEQKDQALKVTELYQSILDGTETAVIVHDLGTGEVFYGNRKLKEIYNINGEIPVTGPEDPLYEERIAELAKLLINREELKNKVTHVEYRKETGRYYQVKGKIIDWCGRESYVEYLTDITDTKKFSEQLQKEHEELKKKYQEEILYSEKAASDETIASCRVNLTHGYVEELRVGSKEYGKELHYAVDFATRIAAFTNEIWLDENQNRNLSPEHLLTCFSQGKRRLSEEYIAELKDGRHVWIKADINLVERPETSEIIAFFYHRDITKESMLSHIIEKIMSFDYDEIYTVDGVNGLVTSVAQGQYALEGQLSEGSYSEELESLKNRTDSIEDKLKIQQELNLEHIQNYLSQEQVYVKEVKLMSKNGKMRLKQLRFMYLHESVGMLLFTMADIDDVVKDTNERQEKLERALQMAEEANATKTGFLASMSHEIRTPMNAIIGLTSIIKDDAANREQVLDCTDKLNSASKYLLALLNDILDMSRIESGNVVLQHQKFSSDSFWDNVNTLALAQAKPAGIEYIFEKKFGSVRSYQGDATRIQQIMVNLINNAVKFTPTGGQVRVSVEELENRNGKCHLQVKVADTGIGISKDFLPNVFKVFTQEHDGNTSSYGGSGLGLSIARNYARMMQGDITVNSSMGNGTTFIVELWLDVVENETEEYQAEKNQSVEELSFNGKHVLLVEDHPLNTMVATRLLNKKGFKVVHAENGRAAVELFENSLPKYFDVILMDIRMPVLDGIEATKEIRALSRNDAATIPIIAMTANAYDEDRRKTKEAGMNAHLAKPIDPQILFATLAEYLMEKKAQN